MSAIAGLWRRGRAAEPACLIEDCEKMLRAQAIYGPDDLAGRQHQAIALGRCLGRVLPEDVYDCGPVEARNCLLVAADRLDNRDE